MRTDTEDKSQSGPLHVAERVGVDGGLGDFMDELWVRLVEMLLDLREDSLLVLR